MEYMKVNHMSQQCRNYHLILNLYLFINTQLGKSVAILTTDNGPDWSGKSPCNLYNSGQLWKKLNLDALILNSYTPGNSRYNPVERSMSPLSNWLVGLTLKREYNSNASKPHNLDDALICLNSYWDKRKYAGFQLDCYPILSYNATGDNHTTTRLLLMKTKPDKQSNLYHDYIFLLKHCIKSHYSYIFIKCYDKKCSHCSINPIRTNLTMELLSLRNNGMPVPSPSIIHPDHFNTFLQTIHACMLEKKIQSLIPLFMVSSLAHVFNVIILTFMHRQPIQQDIKYGVIKTNSK
ncbi:unnamed protein product [Didymodactylos carnosus]|uniref:Uncharacterized protein n=1 Tax=Didymodactylos carnosus TaxID=1234261 RepID=A0A814EG81_9BILA|nr:unnamed protein product [Didymodactylos carnosus]CAF3740424.1 unnamed protein product [Didymodactylos carnosus]